MLTRIIWHDLKWRLLAAAALVALTAGVVILGLRLSPGADYLQHLDLAWFNLPGASSVFLPAAVIIGGSSSLMRPPRDVAYVMSLPVSRLRWVMMHVAASVAALAFMVLVCAVAFIVAASNLDTHLAIVPLFARSLLVLLAAAAWVPLMIALSAVVRRAIIAIPLAFVLLSFTEGNRFQLDIPAKASVKMLPPLDPWAFADPRAWHAGVPFPSIAIVVVMLVAGLAAAKYLVSNRDL